MRFNFEFGEAKSKADPKPKSVKAAKSEFEIKETEEDKETKRIDNVEQTIDELLAADVEALEALNQASGHEIDQNLYDEIKVLDVKLEVIGIENIKQPK